MKAMANRLAALEAVKAAASGVWHRIVQEVGQTRDEALDAYGRDRIGAGENLIIRRIVDPASKHEGIEQ